MDENALQGDSPLMVDCGPHGMRVAAVVCGHILKAQDHIVGFIENSTDPNDLQAWCAACEEMLLREGSLTLAFEKFNDRAIVCVVCYQNLKDRHSEELRTE